MQVLGICQLCGEFEQQSTETMRNLCDYTAGLLWDLILLANECYFNFDEHVLFVRTGHVKPSYLNSVNITSTLQVILVQGLSIALINCLGKAGAHAEAFSVYNMLKYGKRTINKSLHERILHSLLAGGLLKDAYVVVKVCNYVGTTFVGISLHVVLHFWAPHIFQDNAKLISQHSIKKFATSFMDKGNINLVNDVIKSLHSNAYKIDPVKFWLFSNIIKFGCFCVGCKLLWNNNWPYYLNVVCGCNRNVSHGGWQFKRFESHC